MALNALRPMIRLNFINDVSILNLKWIYRFILVIRYKLTTLDTPCLDAGLNERHGFEMETVFCLQKLVAHLFQSFKKIPKGVRVVSLKLNLC